MDDSLATAVKTLKAERDSMKKARRMRSAKIYRLHTELAGAKTHLNEALAQVATQQLALTKARETSVIDHKYRFVSVLEQILSGKDRRPIVWMDFEFHPDSYNTVGVERDAKTNELEFDNDVQPWWLTAKDHFDISTHTVQFNLSEVDDEGEQYSFNDAHCVADFCEEMGDIYHSFIAPRASSAEAIEKEKRVDRGSNFELLPGGLARLTYHYIMATPKSPTAASS